MLPDDELVTLLQGRFRSADSAISLVKEQRRDAMERYHCEPYGDEVDGQSQFITSDVRDNIEWLLPQIVEPFVEGENAVEFTAQNAEDVEQAALETAYVRDVITQQNPGFIEIYNFAKDGLLLKNGVVKSWWDENIVETKENYRDRDIYFYAQLAQHPDVEITAVTGTTPDGEEHDLMGSQGLSPDILEQTKFDIDATRKTDKSKVCFKTIPPENFFVSAGWNSLSLDGCPYVCHRDTIKAWELRAEGKSQDWIDSIGGGVNASKLDQETVERWQQDGGTQYTDGQTTESDKGNRDITIFEEYVYADFKGNGKPELRIIRRAGDTGDKIVSNETVDDLPFDCWTPNIQPHKHYGLSTNDLMGDKQLLKTNIARRTLDSLYHSIYSDRVVREDYTYKEDLLNRGPGAILRVRRNAPADSIVDLTTPFVGQQALPVISLVDDMISRSTGVSSGSQALDLNALSGATNIVGPMVMSQDLMRVKMVLRIFAETGFKGLMRRIHSLCRKYDRQRMFQYQGQFVTVDPQNWNERDQFTVKVGVGFVEKMQRAQGIATIVANQTAILAQAGIDNPLVQWGQYRISLVEQAKLAGYPDAEKFYGDPTNWKPKPQPESPLDQAAENQKAQIVADLHKQSAENAIKVQLANQEDQFKRDKLQQDWDLAREELALKYGVEYTKHQAAEKQAMLAPLKGSGRPISSKVLQAQAEDAAQAEAQAIVDAQNDAIQRQADSETQAAQQAQTMAMQQQRDAEHGMRQDALIGTLANINARLTEIAAPKRVVRDGDGNIVGVEPDAN